MDTQEVPTTKAVGKNRQWILDARPVGKLTGKEFRHARDHPYREGGGHLGNDIRQVVASRSVR